MLQLLRRTPNRTFVTIAAGLASVAILSSLFLVTMLLQYQFIDFSYLLFALWRIFAISTVVAALAFAFAQHLRSSAIAGLLGSIAGLIGGVALVIAAA